MKKYLFLLTVITLVTSNSNQIIINNFIINTNFNQLAISSNLPFKPLTSFENIFYNQALITKAEHSADKCTSDDGIFDHWDNYDRDLAADTKEIYDYLDGKTGTLQLLTSKQLSSSIVKTFNNTYVNNTPNLQTFKTEAYKETITNTHTFLTTLSEKMGVKSKVKFWAINGEVSAEMSNTQTWSDTRTVTETLEAPSQSFTVSPHKLGTAKYVIEQGLYENFGILRIPVTDELLALSNVSGPDAPFFTSKSGQKWFGCSSWDILSKYMDLEQYTSLNSKTYSFWTLTNTQKNPWFSPISYAITSINLPITWISQVGKLTVDLSESLIN